MTDKKQITITDFAEYEENQKIDYNIAVREIYFDIKNYSLKGQSI